MGFVTGNEPRVYGYARVAPMTRTLRDIYQSALTGTYCTNQIRHRLDSAGLASCILLVLIPSPRWGAELWHLGSDILNEFVGWHIKLPWA